MALKPCRECGREVSTEAATCPHCGTPNPTRDAQPTVNLGHAAPRAAAPSRSSSGDWAAGCGIGVLLLFLAIRFGSGSSSSSSTASTYDAPAVAADADSVRAVELCHDAVRAKVGSIATAEFTGRGDLFRRSTQARSFVVGGEVRVTHRAQPISILRGFACPVDVGTAEAEVIFADPPAR